MNTFVEEELRQQNEAASIILTKQFEQIRKLEAELAKYEQVAQKENTLLDSWIATAGKLQAENERLRAVVKAALDDIEKRINPMLEDVGLHPMTQTPKALRDSLAALDREAK